MLYKLSLIAWKWHYPVCTAVWRIEIWTNFKYSLYSHKSTQNCNVSLGFPETHPRSGSPREGQNLALQCDLWPGARSPWRQLNNTVTHSEEERKPSCYSWAINYKEITIEKSYERHLHSRILYSRSKYHKSPYTARMVSFWRCAERPNPLSEVAGAWLKWPGKCCPGDCLVTSKHWYFLTGFTAVDNIFLYMELLVESCDQEKAREQYILAGWCRGDICLTCKTNHNLSLNMTSGVHVKWASRSH